MHAAGADPHHYLPALLLRLYPVACGERDLAINAVFRHCARHGDGRRQESRGLIIRCLPTIAPRAAAAPTQLAMPPCNVCHCSQVTLSELEEIMTRCVLQKSKVRELVCARSFAPLRAPVSKQRVCAGSSVLHNSHSTHTMLCLARCTPHKQTGCGRSPSPTNGLVSEEVLAQQPVSEASRLGACPLALTG